MKIKDRIHNIVTTLDKTSFWQGFVDLYESIIGLLQRDAPLGLFYRQDPKPLFSVICYSIYLLKCKNIFKRMHTLISMGNTFNDFI